MPGTADDGDQVRTALVGGRVEELLGEAQLALASDERRLEARGATPAFPCSDDAERTPERHRLALPLELVLAGAHVRDRGFGRALRRVPDEHASPGSAADWMREAVLTRSPATMPWPSAPTRDGGLAREHAGAGAQCRVEVGATPATSSSAARTARSASSSCATGAPQTAMTASPMNFSTVPP